MDLLRDLAEWTLSWAQTPYSGIAMFALAFAESSFFPIPPDALLIVLAVGNAPFALGFAAITTAASVLGGAFGYLIGLKGGRPLLNRLFSQDKILYVERQYQQRDVWAVLIAAFTPIPYKVFTIGAGVCRVNFLRFMLASVIGRAARFFLVATAIMIFGAQIQTAIEQYLDLLTIAFVVALVAGFVLIKLLTRARKPASGTAPE